MLTTISADAGSTIGDPARRNARHGLATEAVQWLLSQVERRRQLRALSELDEHLLWDVGLSSEDVRRACAQTFWMH